MSHSNWSLTLEEGEKEAPAGSEPGCGGSGQRSLPAACGPAGPSPAGTSRRQRHFQPAGTGPASPLPWKRGGRKRDAASGSAGSLQMEPCPCPRTPHLHLGLHVHP